MSKQSNAENSLKFWLIRIVITAIIGLLVYFIKANIDNKNSLPPTVVNMQVRQDSGPQIKVEKNEKVFQNSGAGQQNNNNDSGTQTINNYR
jgi:anti-sigma-K factor RskA